MPDMKTPTDEALDVVELHMGGLTPIEIARDYGVPRSTVYYYLDYYDLKPNRKRAPELTARKASRIETLLDEGDLSYRQIAEKVHCTPHQVRGVARKRGGTSANDEAIDNQ